MHQGPHGRRSPGALGHPHAVVARLDRPAASMRSPKGTAKRRTERPATAAPSRMTTTKTVRAATPPAPRGERPSTVVRCGMRTIRPPIPTSRTADARQPVRHRKPRRMPGQALPSDGGQGSPSGHQGGRPRGREPCSADPRWCEPCSAVGISFPCAVVDGAGASSVGMGGCSPGGPALVTRRRRRTGSRPHRPSAGSAVGAGRARACGAGS